MPFGLTGAPAVFQRMMNTVVAEMTTFSSAYNIDDVDVFSENIEDHLQHMTSVFEQFRKFGLTAKPSKCQLAIAECKY